jgi:hypothetical protein
MKGTVKGSAKGKERTHEVQGFPVMFTARWLHVVTEDGFDAYIPRTFSSRAWLVNEVDGEPTVGVFVIDNKPMYWLKQVRFIESIYLPEEPQKVVPMPKLQMQEFSKGKLSFKGVPLFTLAPLVGERLWWVESADGVERVITEYQLQKWILTNEHEVINLETRAGTWIKQVTRFCGEKGYILL